MRSLLVLVWIATTVAGFWWYDGRYRLPVQTHPAEHPSQAQSLRIAGAKATLVEFYTPGCGCSKFAETHIADLARRYGPRGLRIVTVVEGTGDAPRYDRVVQDPDGKLARALGVAAAPAAVVLDATGRTLYTGGLNVARFCDERRTAYAEQAIAATLDGKRPLIDHGAFYGCATVAAG